MNLLQVFLHTREEPDISCCAQKKRNTGFPVHLRFFIEKDIHLESTAILPMKVTKNTTISELMQHPAAEPVMSALLDQMVSFMNGMQSENGGGGKTVPKEQLVRMLESSPLRFFHTLPGMSSEQTEDLICTLQKAVDDALSAGSASR